MNCRGMLLSLEEPVVMGILNATDDSFFSGSRVDASRAVDVSGNMLAAGASILDIGGYSSRPNAPHISESMEADRVLPVIESVFRAFPNVILSIDTFRSKIGEAALQAGAAIVNDISAGEDDPEMLHVVASSGAPFVMMHKRGTPQTMQSQAHYEDVVLEVMNYFTARIHAAREAGIKDIVLDPGFGFAKNTAHNYAMLKALSDFRIFSLPLLVGLSRKNMIRQIIGGDASEALNGTTVLNTIALQNGARILRVHDVREAVECIKLVKALHGDL